jgi:hypothetical protein
MMNAKQGARRLQNHWRRQHYTYSTSFVHTKHLPNLIPNRKIPSKMADAHGRMAGGF